MRVPVPATDASVDLELFRGYELAAGSYDEVFAASGVPRPAWQLFLKSVGGITRSDYAHRWEQAQRLLRQNSLAYPDFADPVVRYRPWELDGLPLIIAADEWRTVETGLKQRATLLDEV